MQLQYKPDVEEVLQRFEAWMQGQIIDRPPITMAVKPKRPPHWPQKKHATLRDRWLDMEYAIDCFEAAMEVTDQPADNLPIFMPNLGPEVCATVFGCDLEFGQDTSWSKPIAHSCRDILSIKPNLDNVYWNTIRRGMDVSIRRGAGRWITAITDLHTNGDLLASLRDPQELCLELVDDLEAVRAACDYVTDFFPLLYEDLYNRVAAADLPCTTWSPAVHEGKFYVTSCDFICMISQDMFRRTILPGIQREMRYLERNYFHLDGPNALQHLDDLLEQPELNGIQWVYGAGHGPASRWIDVYKRIQSAGKSIELLAETPEDALAVAEHLRPEGVWVHVTGEYPPEQVEDTVRQIERWAAGK